MDKQNNYFDKALKLGILLAILILAFSVAYYLTWFLPKKEKTRTEQQKQKETQLNECIQEANKDLETARNKLSEKSIDQLNSQSSSEKQLRASALTELINRSKESEADCFKKYPQ